MPLSLVEREAPLPDAQPGSILLLAIPGARSVGIVFKVKAFDPTRHPRGYKGLFIDTPDKIGAGDAKVGDVIATKSGKVFKVEGHGAKGIKVTSVDPDTGEILQKGTIVANGIEVARVEGGKGLGSKHQISTLDPGTYVQHPKSGKRFVIHKHGNWTTVHPVDAHGAVVGKHTVLPPHTEVLVAAKETSGSVTPQTVARVQQQVKPPTTKVDPKNTLGLKVGDQVVRKSSGDIYEVKTIAADGVPYGVDDKGFAFEIQDLYYDRHVPETLPQNLPRPPSSYASGVGKNTAVVIVEIPEVDYVGRLHARKSSYQLRRVPDPNKPNDPGELLGSYNGIGAARKAARSIGENHEAVIETRNGARDYVPKVDDWVMRDGVLRQILAIETQQPGSYYSGNKYTFHDAPHDQYYMYQPFPVPDIEALRKYARDNHGATLVGGTIVQHYGGGLTGGKEIVEEALRQNTSDPKTVRAARPNLYLEALRHDFDPSELVGKTKGEALGTLRKLGYGEITPREPNMTKLVNARGARVHVHNKGGVVTSIDAIQRQQLTGSGAAAFHAQLTTILATGGDVRALDPRDTGNVEEGTAITKTLLYDMALGKQNGVEKLFQGSAGSIKVKSDAAYHSEILADASFPKKASFVNDVEDPGLNIPIRQDVMDKHFPGWQSQTGIAWTGNNLHIKDPTEEEATAAAAIASGERNGIAEHVAKTYGTDFRVAAVKFGEDWASYQANPTDPNNAFMQLSQGQRDYLLSTLLDVTPRAQRQWQLRQTEKERRLDGIYEQKITEETSKRRKAEGTVANAPGTSDTFELPLWDEIELQEQDLGDVESLIQNAPTTTLQAPMFFTGGILKDGFATVMKRDGRVVVEAKVPKEFDDEAMQRVGGRQTGNSRFPNPHGSSGNRISQGVMFVLDDGGGKKIEYVPHGGRAVPQTTPANQRGRLTFHGYTPEEAAARMKDLGLVHDTETHVPFTSILRSRRRYGTVLPLHPDYVSGEAAMPQIPCAISHGMGSHNVDAVFSSGSLLSISERFKLGIDITAGCIPRQDIAAGVDHLVFAAMSPNTSNYGDVTVVYKDSAYLRRDIIVVDRNFVNSGGADGRYPAYRKYHNDRRREAGITGAAADVGAYEVLEPKARQAHINNRMRAARTPDGLSASQNEWDLAGGVPIEDMAVVVVPTQQLADKLDRKLNSMLNSGQISERPTVEVSSGGYRGSPITGAQRPGFTAPRL